MLLLYHLFKYMKVKSISIICSQPSPVLSHERASQATYEILNFVLVTFV